MTEPSAGTLIGQYEVVSLIGQGTTGSVYRAVDTETGRTVAVKRITTLPSDQQRSAFHREARILAGLHHPAVLRLVELIDTAEHLALVTEYCSGGSLRDALRSRGAFTPQQVVTTLTPIVSALAAAHHDGIIHRDVKPSNIVMRDDNIGNIGGTGGSGGTGGIAGQPVLADFGLALTDPGVSQTSSAALGSASYLDPEVADGALPTGASDLYSLGVVAYELLTGTTPFVGESPLAVLRAADRGDHQVLDPAHYGPLATVVERAIARNPVQRFPDATSLLEALQSTVDSAQNSTVDASVGLATAEQNRAAATVLGAGAAQSTESDPANPGLRTGVLAGRVRPEQDRPTDQTTAFRLPHRPHALDAADPVSEKRNWRRIAIVGAFAVGIGAVTTVLGVVRSSNRSEIANGVVPFRVNCDSSITAQCVGAVTRTPEGILVKFAEDERPTLFTVGKRTDALRVSNFFCGAAETLAVYRPSNGVIYYFKQWPLPGEQTDVRADATGVVGAEVVVADHNGDGCGDIGLETGGKNAARTWFMPHVQNERLQTIDRSATPPSAA